MIIPSSDLTNRTFEYTISPTYSPTKTDNYINLRVAFKDKVFTENSNQKDIFNITSKNVVESVLSGYNGTIFAYGQTGSGKTYTMVGEYDDPVIKGIIPRAFDYIFDRIQQIQKEDQSVKYTIYISFIQIYLEMIQDLLEPNNQVKIREDPDKGVFLEN